MIWGLRIRFRRFILQTEEPTKIPVVRGLTLSYAIRSYKSLPELAAEAGAFRGQDFHVHDAQLFHMAALAAALYWGG